MSKEIRESDPVIPPTQTIKYQKIVKNHKKSLKERKGRTLKKQNKEHIREKTQKEINKVAYVANEDEQEFRIRSMEVEMKIMEMEMKLLQIKQLERIRAIEELEDKEKPYEDSADDELSESDEDSSVVVEIESETVTNDAPSTEVNNKFDVDDLHLAVMNARGLAGKYQSMSNAANMYDMRIMVVSETHCIGKDKPYINDNMEAFFENRNCKKNKGGVAVFLEKTLAKQSVIIGKSSSENEWVAVKCNYFSPP